MSLSHALQKGPIGTSSVPTLSKNAHSFPAGCAGVQGEALHKEHLVATWTAWAESVLALFLPPPPEPFPWLLPLPLPVAALRAELATEAARLDMVRMISGPGADTKSSLYDYGPVAASLLCSCSFERGQGPRRERVAGDPGSILPRGGKG